jgi:hypothetical protein
MKEESDLRIAKVSMDDNDIIVVTMKDCELVDEYDVMDLNLVIRHKAAGIPRLKLVIAHADFDLTKKAKEMAEKEDRLSQTKARAIVVSNGLKASLMNFFKAFSDRGYPVQFFKDRDEAYKWLLTLR